MPVKRDDTDGDTHCDTYHDTPYDTLRDTDRDTLHDTLRDTVYDTPRDIVYDTVHDTQDDIQCGHIPRLDQDQTKLRPDYNYNKTTITRQTLNKTRLLASLR